jgi:dTDP-4-dehydro-6-deoxy-alpha-D-glucopyranose 2,3-dehydratase
MANDEVPAARAFFESELAADGRLMRTDGILDWLQSRRAAHSFSIRQMPLHNIKGWHTDPTNGYLAHQSGRFFTVEGLKVTTTYPREGVFYQPIINQPEVGILGILARRIDGVMHFMMQAKMEPGNINLVQLSPTVQATRSNYKKVHGGNAVRYLEYFADRSRGRVLVDQLQSEQGSFFLRKRNRNIIVETNENVPEHPDFCWMTLGQLKAMLRHDDVVNMDTRTVISGIPFTGQKDDGFSGFRAALVASALARNGGEYSNNEIISWLTELKSVSEIRVQSVQLHDLPGWTRDDWSIHRTDKRHFSIIGISVEADSREVNGWCQPIVRPSAMGITGFLIQRRKGVLHFLVHARMEAGTFDMLELSPTVQYLPGSQESDSPFLSFFRDPVPQSVRFCATQSEEGGRFYQYRNKNMVVQASDTTSIDAPAGYIWMTLGQLQEFVRYNNYLNIEARGLLACLTLAEGVEAQE